ncbi:hypothetical protein G7K_6494-t1 [Saitoella complicata NRRL Y-17804]|uniref:Carrier domain-containing protein n=2 Tax=Saitoella complicata (strain BCRC 22490 / CBS 7301 / JCM 7358 / NBRC 10748 / NRRL Y-17804) TaxID=698492 RepID=A0A0E9NRX1_SAICN|nr:hypothetical protein G7K_6494-t1 [Saitoella complicata NRRL Y-17804]
MDLEPDWVAASLACWMTGRSFLALNLGWSSAITKTILERHGIKRVLYSHATPKSQVQGVDIYDLGVVVTREKSDRTKREWRGPGEISLYITTSGSTGVPKSVPVLSATLAAYCEVRGKSYPVDAMYGLVAAPGFAMTCAFLGFVMVSGSGFVLPGPTPPPASSQEVQPGKGPLVELSPGEKAARRMIDAIRRGADVVTGTPTILSMTAGLLAPGEGMGVKVAFAGGEALVKPTLFKLRAAFPRARISAMFGSSECYCANFRCDVAPGEEDDFEECVYEPNWPVNRILYVDPENDEPGKVIVDQGRTEGRICIVTDAGNEPYLCVDGDEKSAIDAKDTFRVTENGEKVVLFADYGVKKTERTFVVGGRTGRRIKMNGVFVDLSWYDTFIMGAVRVGDLITLAVGSQVVVTYVPAPNSADPEDLRSTVNGALKREGVSHLVVEMFPVKALPMGVTGKKDFKTMQGIAEKMVKEKRLAGLADLREEDEDARKISEGVAEILKNDILKGRDFELARVGVDSITAVQVSAFVRKTFGVAVPASEILAETATPRILAAALQAKLAPESQSAKRTSLRAYFAAEIEDLSAVLPKDKFDASHLVKGEVKETIFVTGCTGFLGTFILRQLLRRPSVKVICHVRASTESEARERIVSAAKAALYWKDEYESRVEFWTGDLAAPRIGLSDELWQRLCAGDVTGIVHNGAAVHWVKPYEALKAPNAVSTRDVVLAAMTSRHVKHVVFISGGGQAPLDVEDNETALVAADGYAHGKYVAEGVCQVAHQRGYPVYVVRPGFIVGASDSGVSNTDDFIWRLAKCAIEMGIYQQDAELWTNMTPVDVVADVILHKLSNAPESLIHTINQEVSFDGWYEVMKAAGYYLKPVDAETWMSKFEDDIEKQGLGHPLFPLLERIRDGGLAQFARRGAKRESWEELGYGPAENTRKSLMYLISVGFLGKPAGAGNLDLGRIDVLGTKGFGRTGRATQAA